MIDEELDRDTVPAVNRRKLLWGFLPFDSAIETLRQAQSMLDPLGQSNTIDVEELRTKWERAGESIDEAEVDLTQSVIEDIPDEPAIQDHLTRLKEMAFFQNSYGDPDAVRFGLVPLEKIVALQGAVTVTAHQDIKERVSDLESTLEYVFPTERGQGYFTQTIQTEGNELVGIQLTSRAPNISVQDLRMFDGERPMEKHVRFTVRAPPNLVNGFTYDNRFYLNNGYHRAYQLLEAGESHIPAIIREADEFPAAVGDMPRDTVLAERPPLLTDFASEAATEFRLPATNELIRITAESTKVFR